jgi:hypothetical protein
LIFAPTARTDIALRVEHSAGFIKVERFFALLTDQHLRRAYFCKPDIA